MSVWIATSHFESKNSPHGLVQGNTVNSKSAVLALIAYSFFSNSILLFFDRGTELLPFVQRFLSGMVFSIYEVVQMACQSCSWFVYGWGINKKTTWLARKKPLLPGYRIVRESISGNANIVLNYFKTESIRKLSNFNFQWTKTLYQNKIQIISHSFLHFFKGYRYK